MRAILFGVLLLGAAGCGGKNDLAAPNVKLEAEVDPGSTPDPTPPRPKPVPPKSLLGLNVVRVCEEVGPKQLSPEEVADRLIGAMHFQLRPNPYLAAQVVGGGLAGPIPAVIRIHAQPEVVKRVKAGAEKPVFEQGVSLRGSVSTTTGLGGTSRTFMVIPGSPAETAAIFGKVAHGVSKAAVEAGATAVRFESPGATTSHRISYSTPDRTGTITLVLLTPGADTKAVDAVLPPNDIGRAVLAGREPGETWLVVAVDEK